MTPHVARNDAVTKTGKRRQSIVSDEVAASDDSPRTPPLWMKAADVVGVEGSLVGILRNLVVTRPNDCAGVLCDRVATPYECSMPVDKSSARRA